MAADGSLIFDTNLDDSGVRKGLNKLGNIGSTALKGIGIATAAVVAGVVALGISAIKVGSEFSAQMSRVQAISGATAEELKKINKLAIDLGASTSFSASEAAAGMENLASAGFSVNEIMDAMPGLLDLAAVSGGDVAGAAEVAASALNAFGLEASEAGHVADVFAQAAASTNAEALDMGEAMKYVAPVAKAMGLSLEETAAAIGIMSDAGIKGGQAGTALRGALSRLAKPTKAMSETMKQLGLDFYDTEGKMLPLSDQVAMLKGKMEGLTQEQQNNALVTLYGQESLSGMLALIDAGPEKLDALTDSLVNSDGAAATMAGTMTNNLQGALDGLSGAFETFQITLFQSGETPLKSLAEKGTEYINQLTTAFQEGGFEGLVEEFGNVISDIILNIIDSIPQMVTAAQGFIGSLLLTLVSKLPEFITMGLNLVMNLVSGIVAALPQMLDSGFKALQSLIDGIITYLPQLITMAMTMIQTLAQGLMDNLPAIIQGGVQILVGLLEGIADMLPELITMAIDMIILIADNLIDNIDVIIDAGIEIIFALIDGLIENLPKLIAEVPRIINKFADAIYSLLPKILSAGIKLLGELGKGIVQAIPTLLANLPQIIMAIINVFTLANMFSAGKGLITRVGEGIKNAGGSAVTYIKGVAKNILDGIINSFSGAGSIGKNLVQGIWNGIGNAKQWILDKIAGFGASIIGGLKSIFGIHSPSKVMEEEIGEMLPPGIGKGLENAMPDLQDDVNKEMKALTAKMEYTVAAETSDVAMKMTSGTAGRQRIENEVNAEDPSGGNYIIEVTSVLDGREVGKGTAEFSSLELEKKKKRRK